MLLKECLVYLFPACCSQRALEVIVPSRGMTMCSPLCRICSRHRELQAGRGVGRNTHAAPRVELYSSRSSSEVVFGTRLKNSIQYGKWGELGAGLRDERVVS